jgi:hypothetical protein
MPELYEHLNPMPFETAAQMEIKLAKDLRARGYTVAGVAGRKEAKFVPVRQ